MRAKQHGFRFKAAEREHEKRVTAREEIIEDIGEKPQPIKVTLALICIAIAVCLGYIEAQNVKTTIIGNAGFSETAAVFVGWAFACMGLVTGELLSAKSSFHYDEFTGRKRPATRWYLGLALTIVYLLGQYYLASRAGVGVGEETQETVDTMKWFVLGIAIIEVLFGMAFLSLSLKVLTLCFANIRVTMALNTMKSESRKTEEYWQRHLFERNGVPAGEETPAIQDARRFYATGIVSEHRDPTPQTT